MEQLLVDYLERDPTWVEMLGVLQASYGGTAEFCKKLTQVRNMFAYEAPGLSDFSSYLGQDRLTLVRTLGMLGFAYPAQDDGMFSDSDYLRIAQNLAAYYRDQGTESFLNFFSYCIGNELTLKPLWTEDYQSFYPEGDPTIGTPVWSGGTWYPTSHVRFEVLVWDKLDPYSFRKLFDYLAPLNLVLLGTIFRQQATNTLVVGAAARMSVREAHVFN